MKNSLLTFKNKKVRMIIKDGDPWWVAKDVCEVLGITKYRDAITKLDADERGSLRVDTLGGSQEMACVAEPGLYRLIARSDKPDAKTFLRWVTHEVLPSIRKTGIYGSNLPTRSELARMVIELESKNEIAGEIFDKIRPGRQYGEISSNGQQKCGLRRAAWVAAKNRLNEAAMLLQLSAQMELRLSDSSE